MKTSIVGLDAVLASWSRCGSWWVLGEDCGPCGEREVFDSTPKAMRLRRGGLNQKCARGVAEGDGADDEGAGRSW